jgi:hypothetical protein
MQRPILAVARGARMASTAAPRSSSALGTSVYQLVFRRNAVYATAIFGAAVVIDSIYGSVMDNMWTGLNRGVRQRTRKSGARSDD